MNNNSTKLPVLYSFRRCPYAIRARMAIKYSEISVEIREVVLRDKPESMIKASPKGSVPVLILENSKVIDESRDIMDWALSINDINGWLSINIDNANKLIDQNDSFFKSALDKYKYFNRYPEKSQEFYRNMGEEFLKELNDMLENNEYLFGSEISFADIAIFPFVRQFAYVDKNWFDETSYKKLQKWLDSFLQSQLFNSIMDKYLPWKEGDEVIVF